MASQPTNASNKAANTVHVVFGHSIADTLRHALPLLGSTERVIGLPDDLSVGPIDPPDPHSRQAWTNAVLRPHPALRLADPATIQAAWAEATAPGIHPVFWACLASPMEHACFLAFAARMQHRPFDIVDATGLPFTTLDGVANPWSLGLMRVPDILASNLYARRRPTAPEERRAASAAWSELQRENAPLRIVKDGRLVSAPLTHHDTVLIDQASHEWEIAARLIGRTITRLSFQNLPPGQATSDTVLFGRLLALADAGSLEITGPGPGLRDYQVRKPPVS